MSKKKKIIILGGGFLVFLVLGFLIYWNYERNNLDKSKITKMVYRLENHNYSELFYPLNKMEEVEIPEVILYDMFLQDGIGLANWSEEDLEVFENFYDSSYDEKEVNLYRGEEVREKTKEFFGNNDVKLNTMKNLDKCLKVIYNEENDNYYSVNSCSEAGYPKYAGKIDKIYKEKDKAIVEESVLGYVYIHEDEDGNRYENPKIYALDLSKVENGSYSYYKEISKDEVRVLNFDSEYVFKYRYTFDIVDNNYYFSSLERVE